MDVLRVLIVEDSPIVAERLSESLLAVRGLRIIDTIDRENKAIEALERGGIDVVVLDLRLNRGTGFGVLRALSARAEANDGGREARPVVIIFTNYDLPEYRRQALALGADYFLDKARDFERLPGLIETLRGKPPENHPPELVPA
jgi:DNA-binding NarL/FixJ family response regulator